MLSYKIKHLFSCVIASLSVFGFMSISEKANAAQDGNASNYWQPGGQTSVYNIVGNGTVTAAYLAALDCPSVANATAKTITVAGGVTTCRYDCNDGYRHSFDAGGTDFIVSGSTVSELAASLDLGSGQYCQLGVATCNADGNSTLSAGAPVEVLVEEGGKQVRMYRCNWTCAAGYQKNGANSFTGSQTAYSGVIFPGSTDNCSGRTYELTLDCGNGGAFVANTTIDGVNVAGKQTATMPVVYGQKVTIPAAAKCTKPRAEFLGYDKKFNTK